MRALLMFLLITSAHADEARDQQIRAAHAEWMRAEADVRAALVERTLTPEQAHEKLVRAQSKLRERVEKIKGEK